MLVLDPVYYKSTVPEMTIEVNALIDDPDNVGQKIRVPVVLDGANIVMNLMNGNVLGKQYSTADNTITTADNIITIPEHEMTAEPADYEFDFNIILSTGKKITGFAPGRREVLPISTIR
jgi:hypothetical protein